MRWSIAFVWLLVGCAPPSHRCPGIPVALDERSVGLLETEGSEPRKCQMLVEPFRSVPHAVWFTYGDSGPATVVVRFEGADGGEEQRAKLDRGEALMLDRLCEQFLRDPPKCERIAPDGAYFHVAHHVAEIGYLTRTFWLPRHDSVDGRFVQMMSALRDYALVPAVMRLVKLHDLRGAAASLAKAIASGSRELERTLLLGQID